MKRLAYPSLIRGKREGEGCMKIENPASVWRLKVELLGVAPTVWRRFDTYADVKLSQLHYFIQGAMGWELAHLFWRRLAAPGDDREDDGQADRHLPAHGRWQVRLSAGRLRRAVGLCGHAQGARWQPQRSQARTRRVPEQAIRSQGVRY